MKESVSHEGFHSLEEQMQEYVDIFLWLQQDKGKTPGSFEEKRALLEERERKTALFLPSVCLRECCSLTQAEYWVLMFAFCFELENGLCIDCRNRYKENWPSLQYAMYLLSPVIMIGFDDVAGFCGGGGALQDILILGQEEEETEGRWERGLLQRPLLLNPAVFYFLLTGSLAQEDWYSFYAASEEIHKGQELFPLHEEEYRRLCGYLREKEPLRILLHGSKGSGAHTLVRRAARELGRNVVVFRVKSLMCASKSRRSYICQALCLIIRLSAPVVAVELADEIPGSPGEEWEQVRSRLLRGLGGSHLCILANTPAQVSLVREETDVGITLKDALSREEKRLALDAWISPEDRRQWQEDLLGNYRLNVGEWKKRQKTISLRAREGARSLSDQDIWLEAMQDRQEASRFGKFIEDRYGPEELILPEDCRRQLETVARLAKAWRGKQGLQVLFYGSSGTGKTMAAAVLAGQLQLPLWKVDLSQVFDKYIGETEKHIDEIFRLARRNRYLLFFDEADALFAKRTAVKDSHDRYANVSAAFLLQRMEEHEGILILATNLKDHFDDAFVRRIRFAVKFRGLEREGRARLWRKALEGGLPVARDVDFNALAEAAELSPARISAAAHVAKLLASCDGSGAVTGGHLREALALEAGKDETAIRGF
mgnify:FL=1